VSNRQAESEKLEISTTRTFSVPRNRGFERIDSREVTDLDVLENVASPRLSDIIAAELAHQRESNELSVWG
jgi:hypothetical protein